ncbi:MAG: four helix bundle protein [Terriglobales bacterium]
MQDFRNLDVWHKSHEVTLAIYQLTRKFPREEQYGLTSQMRRCSVSIAANIAEGCGRRGDPELARFLQIAMGSASELEYELLLAHDLQLINDSDFKRLGPQVTRIKRMLASLLTSLRVPVPAER